MKRPGKQTVHQPIGRILIEAGRLTPADAQRVAQLAAEFKMRFGDMAVEMELVKRSDVDYALGQQFSFPRLDVTDPALSPNVVAAYQPEHPTVERLRELRTQILARAAVAPRRHPMVSIVSPDRGDGRSFVAANLAVVFAQMGHNTLLIDADMRNPSQHEYFRCENRLGLSSMLAERCGVECVYRVPSFPRIFVLTAGAAPPNPVELLEGPIFSQVLSSADVNFKAVIVDTPASTLGADARVVAARAGANVVVSRFGHTKAEHAGSLVRSLAADGTAALGVVMNEY